MTVQNLKLRVPVRFPVQVQGAGGISVAKSNGTWTIKNDFSTLSELSASLVSDPSTKQLAIYDPILKQYNILTLADLGNAMFQLTSTTSVTIGTGSQSFTTQSGKDVSVGDWLIIKSDANPTANYMLGQITSYSGTALVVNVLRTAGSGAHADWTMDRASPVGGELLAANNLSDVSNVATARSNLGLSDALHAANNLSDVANAGTARTNLGLGGAAVLNVGTTTGTVAAGDDSRITSAAQKTSTRTTMAALTGSTANALILYGEAGRNGDFIFDGSNLSSSVTADGQQGIYVPPSGAPTGASGAWTRIRHSTEVRAAWFGASTSNTAAANTTAINAAISYVNGLGGGVVTLGEGTFLVNTILMKDGVALKGVNRKSTILSDTRADTNPVIASSLNTTTMLWAKVMDIQIQKPNAAAGAVVVDMTSWQFGEVGYCWITGAAAVLGVEGIRMRGIQANSTEGTYNHVHNNYIGLVGYGIRMGYDANSCWIEHNRIQPALNSGKGIYVGSTGAGDSVAGFPNQVTISQNSVEQVGGTYSSINGVFLEANATNIVIANNRFEGAGLGDAIIGTAGCVGFVYGNMYSSNTGAKVNGVSSTFVSLDGSDGQVVVPSGSISIIGTTGAKQGKAHNLTGVRNSAGNYTFTFIYAMTDGTYKINASPVASAASTVRVSSKTSTAFTIITEAAGTAADVTQLDVTVFP